MIPTIIGLLLIAVGFILISRFIEDGTVRLIGQIVLGVVLIVVILRYFGIH